MPVRFHDKHFKDSALEEDPVFPDITATVLADLVADEFVFGEIARSR